MQCLRHARVYICKKDFQLEDGQSSDLVQKQSGIPLTKKDQKENIFLMVIFENLMLRFQILSFFLKVCSCQQEAKQKTENRKR